MINIYGFNKIDQPCRGPNQTNNKAVQPFSQSDFNCQINNQNCYECYVFYFSLIYAISRPLESRLNEAVKVCWFDGIPIRFHFTVINNTD